MKSWVLTAPQTFEFLEEEFRSVDRADLAKIKLEACMVSATDLRVYSGILSGVSYPIVPGRQGVGVVSEVSDDNECCFEKGDRVVVDPFMPCGSCLNCKTNKSGLCAYNKTLGLNTNGLFTDFKTLKCTMLHKIPEHVSNETALFTEYAAIALSIIDKISILEGEHVAIFSACKLGFVLAQIVSYYQAIPIIIEADEAQLAILSNCQIGIVINPKVTDLNQAIKETTGGRKCEKVVYIANPDTNLNDAINCCGFSGSLCISGVSAVPPNSGDFTEVQRKQLTVTCVANGHKNFPSAINLLATKTIKHLPIVTQKLSFNEIPEVFKELNRFKARYCGTKVIID